MAASPATDASARTVVAKDDKLSVPDQVELLTRDTFDWLRYDSEEALLSVAIAVAIYFIFVGARWGIVRALGGSGDVTTWKGFAGRIIRRTRTPFIAILAAYVVAHVIAPPGPLRAAIDFFFTIGFAVQGAIWLREIILAMVERRAEHSEDPGGYQSAINVIRVLVNVTVWILATILVLDNLGVNVTALVAGLGVGGIAIGLAAQGIFSDLFAALAILFDRPFRVGETIQFGGQTGTVEAIGLKTVRIRALSGEQLVVGNTQLLGQQISNLKRIEERRIVLLFGIIYQTPPEVMEQLPEEVRAVVESVPHARFDRAVFTGFGASSIDFELVFFVDVPEIQVMVAARHAIGVGLVRRFAALGVEFAYPSQTSFTAAPDGTLIDPRERMPVGGEVERPA
ncbi:mechanosensitive ion channel family protein [Polymorphobacter sp.]|uniref:mechanosensitive ion channel family protein n=1 Tax=Polymorphobacter sp. TaxID=1909290 RepID=UPI003F6F376F